MKLWQKYLSLIALVGLSASSMVAPAGAISIDDDSRIGRVSEPLSDAHVAETAGLPSQLRMDVQELAEGPLGGQINGLAWQRDKGQLEVHILDSAPSSELSAAVEHLVGENHEFVQDAFDREVLEKYAYELAKEGIASGVPIAAVRVSGDSSKLVVSLHELLTDEGMSLDESLAKFKASSSFPVVFNTEPESPSAAEGWRYGDESPFYGGSAIYVEQGDEVRGCTTAFPVVSPVTGGYLISMLTADHCGPNGEVWRSGQPSSGNWAFGALADGNSGGSDIKRVSLQQGSGIAGRVYVGAYTGDAYSGLTARIYPTVGDIICSSGSRSGLSCNAEVMSTGDVICYALIQCYNNLVTVKSVDGTALFGQGDSGGPMIAPWNGGIAGMGVISGMNRGDNLVTCKGRADRECSKVGYFANLKAFFDNNPSWNLLGG